MSEAKDTFEARVSRLSNYIIRAYKYNKPSILFAMYLSEFLRADIEKSLEKSLKEQGLKVVNVDAGKNKDIPSFISSMNSDNTVFLVHNMERGFPDALQFLNFKREELIGHQSKVVFWVKEEELARISTEAPDFFAFRNRVVEFMEVPLAGEFRPALVEFALEAEYKSRDEIRRSIELKEKLLTELSNETEITEYLLGSLGILYNKIGYYKKSIECHEKALKIAKEIGDRQGESASLGNLGLAYKNLSQFKKAIEYFEKSLKIAQEIGDKKNEGINLGNLGLSYRNIGDVKKSIEYHEKALKIAQEIGDRQGEGIWLGSLGLAYHALGKVKKAIEYYEMALKIAQELGDRMNEGTWIGHLGIAYGDLGDLRKSIEYYGKALKTAKEIGDRQGEGAWLGSLGNAYQTLGDVKKAIEHHLKSLKITQEIGDRTNEGIGLSNLGYFFHIEKKYEEALACYIVAKDIRTKIEDPELKTTESNLEKLKEELGEKEFEKLEAEVAPRAAEIVKKILEGISV